jgi:hypothetical protein
MRRLEKDLRADFAKESSQRAQRAKLLHKCSAPLRDLMSKDKSAAEAIREMRRLAVGARKRKVPLARTAPPLTGIIPGLTGVSATVQPPYDYDWTWNAVDGKGLVVSDSANHTSGRMALDLETNDDSVFRGDVSSAVTAQAAVGIYFYPPMSGNLQLWSSPSYDYFWGISCFLEPVHADAWIGFLVESYDLYGNFTGFVVDQHMSLWSGDESIFAYDKNDGSVPAYGLHSPPVPVDRNHQYRIWVRCGGYVAADGWHWTYGSQAIDQLNVKVLSITWSVGQQVVSIGS